MGSCSFSEPERDIWFAAHVVVISYHANVEIDWIICSSYQSLYFGRTIGSLFIPFIMKNKHFQAIGFPWPLLYMHVLNTAKRTVS